MREITGYCEELFRQGVFKGATPDESFYVKCDAETNTRDTRQAGQVITEVGLALAVPSEFIVARIIHGTSGVTVTTQTP
jgi:phage tail sheath protein FI